MSKRLMFLTGSPGIGKTTVLMSVIKVLKEKGYTVGGMISNEVRNKGRRIGFEINDVGENRRGWLAQVNQKSGPRLGRYRVNLDDLDRLGSDAIAKAVQNSDVIVIDEIGPMEMLSETFKESAKRALDSSKLVVGVVHWKAKDELSEEARKRDDAEVTVVTRENRKAIDREVARRALDFMAIRDVKRH